MKILIVDNGSTYLAKLKSLTSKYPTSIKKYSTLTVADHTGFDLIILSGGHNYPVIDHDSVYQLEIDLIKDSPTPILGICLGFELIAHVFDATLVQISAKEKSILEIGKIVQDPVLDGLSSLKVFENHRYVVRDVGPSLVAIAGSVDGIEIIRHKDRLIYGFQFHPEMFRDETQGDELFANFIKIVENKEA